MEVKKAVLLNSGYDGMKVSGLEYKKRNSQLIPVIAEKTIKIPIPKNIPTQMNRLRVHLLWLTNHWHKALDAFVEDGEILDQEVPKNKLDQENYTRATALMSETEITGVEITKKGGVIIYGEMQSLISTTFKLVSPEVGEDDGYPEFDSMFRVATGILNKINLFMDEENVLLMDPKAFLKQFTVTSEDEDQVEQLSEEEAEEKMIEALEKKGHIVMLNTEYGIKDTDEPDQVPNAEFSGQEELPVRDLKQHPITNNEVYMPEDAQKQVEDIIVEEQEKKKKEIKTKVKEAKEKENGKITKSRKKEETVAATSIRIERNGSKEKPGVKYVPADGLPATAE